MASVDLTNEMKRLLTDPPMGGLSALARACDVTSASVSAWRQGQSAPTPDYWPKIETFFSLPAGYLKEVAAGMRRNKTQAMPAWPSGSLRSDRDLSRRVAQLEGEVTELRRAVRELQEHAKTGASKRSASKPAVRAGGAARRSKS